MSDIFISYARSTEAQAQAIAEALRDLGYGVWRDDELPAHRDYSEVIEERLRAAKAVVVIWSTDAVKSQWVKAEADLAREAGTLVQLSLDGALPPMPFNRIQCADMTGWAGDSEEPGWRKVVASVADLTNGASPLPKAVSAEPALALPAMPSIGLLPFADMTGTDDEDYFVDGMMEEIVGALSRFRSIFVIASGSTMAFKGKVVSPQAVGRQLGVRYVLEGSVRKAGGRVRIAVKLIDAANAAQIWGERFEDTLEDIFALQDRVALSVASVIEPAVREAEIRRIVKRPTDDMGCYDLYLRATAILRSYAWSDIFEAIRLCEQAVDLDPNFGPALSLASRCHYLVVLYGWSEDPEPHARAAIEIGRRAIRAAPDDAEVVATYAMMKAYLENDIEGASASADRACAINPGAAIAWSASGAVRILAGDLDLAIEHLDRSLRLNPIGPGRASGMLFKAMALFQQRRFEEAAALGDELFQHFENPTGCAILAASYGHLGRAGEARAALAHYQRLAPQSIEAYARSVWRLEHHLELFMGGVALAEGKSP
jgi:adenylate cyclase